MHPPLNKVVLNTVHGSQVQLRNVATFMKKNTLPEKVMQRHRVLLQELLPVITRMVIENGRPADVQLAQYLRTHKEHGSRDRRFLSQALFTYFRWYGWTVKTLGLSVEDACLLGSLLDAEPAELPTFDYLQTKSKTLQMLPPFCQPNLADKAGHLSVYFADTIENLLTSEQLIPEEAIPLIDAALLPLFIEAAQQRPPVWIRTRTHPEVVTDALEKQEITYHPHERLHHAISLTGGTNLNTILAEHAARYVVQDIASQCVAHACMPKRGDDWWDCCAGAGGKSIHLIDLMRQEGKVFATDVRPKALQELKKRTRKLGIRNIRTQIHNAANDEPFSKQFDGVLVDAPCSGWGTWSRNPDARWRTSRSEINQCANRQLKILNNATWCVKPKGTLVYAVCTITRAETEEVVSQFLDQNPQFKLEPFTHPLTGNTANGTLQIWPQDGPGDGMFIARFRRKKD